MSTPQKELSIKEAANLRGISMMTIKRWIKRKHLPARMVGGKWMMKYQDVKSVPLHINSKPFKKTNPKDAKVLGVKVVPPKLPPKEEQPEKTKVTLFSLMDAHTPKEKMDLLFKMLLLLPSIGIAYWIGSRSVGLVIGEDSALAGWVWMLIIAILNLSFIFLRARGIIQVIRVVLILITSLIGVSVIDSIVFSQTIKTLRQENLYAVSGIQLLQQEVAQRRVILDSSTVAFTREVIGTNANQGGYGPIAQQLNRVRQSDSIALQEAKTTLARRLEEESARIEKALGTRDWFLDLSLLYKNTFTDIAKIIVFLLIFGAVLILEVLPLLFFMQHGKKTKAQ